MSTGDLAGWDDDPLGMPDPTEGWLLGDIQSLIASANNLRGIEHIEQLEIHEMLLNAVCMKVAEHFAGGVVPVEIEQPLVEFFPREWKRAAGIHWVQLRRVCFHCGKLIMDPGRQVCQNCLGM